VASGVGAGLGHGQAALRQMAHELEVEGQLVGRQALEQRQHPLALLGAQEVVGVFDAAADRVERAHGPQVQLLGQGFGLGPAHFGVDGHADACGDRAARSSQRAAGFRT
jgi:hypothetical protein